VFADDHGSLFVASNSNPIVDLVKILIFANGLGLGGTEKAACRWARGLGERGHDVFAVALADGQRRTELEKDGIPAQVVEAKIDNLAAVLHEICPAEAAPLRGAGCRSIYYSARRL